MTNELSSGIFAPVDDHWELGFGHSLGIGYLVIGHFSSLAAGTIDTFLLLNPEFRRAVNLCMGWGVDFFATIGMDNELSPERGGNHEKNIQVFVGRRRGSRAGRLRVAPLGF